MKAAVNRRYGPPDVVRIETVADPVPGPGQLLVAVEAAGLSVGDARIRGLRVPRGMGVMVRLAFGLRAPRRIIGGREFAGRVAGLGKGFSGFAVGDAVFGITDGMTLGAHAERVVVSADGRVLPRPGSLDPVAAAGFFFGGLTAADFLIDQCRMQSGDRVLVVGASGAVGSAAVQIAAHLGARVTGLTSARNLDLARDLGAEAALDYRAGPPEGPFDIILDCPGALGRPLDLLAPGGRLGLVTASLGQTLGALIRPRRGGKTIHCAMIKETRAAMDRLIGLHAAGGYDPLIGAELPFAEIAKGHALADSGHKRGNLVLRMIEG